MVKRRLMLVRGAHPTSLNCREVNSYRAAIFFLVGHQGNGIIRKKQCPDCISI